MLLLPFKRAMAVELEECIVPALLGRELVVVVLNTWAGSGLCKSSTIFIFSIRSMYSLCSGRSATLINFSLYSIESIALTGCD